MPEKIKLTMVAEVTFEAQPDNYPEEARTPAGMAEFDARYFETDPGSFVDSADTLQINWSIVEEN